MARRSGKPLNPDPAFAAEVGAIAEEHFREERERMRRPPTTAENPLKPVHVSVLHAHDDRCLDNTPRVIRDGLGHVVGIGRRCKTGSYVIDEPNPSSARVSEVEQRATPSTPPSSAVERPSKEVKG